MREIYTLENKREIGIDLVKVFACLGVVSLHTLHPNSSAVSRVITLLATMSIPLFLWLADT